MYGHVNMGHAYDYIFVYGIMFTNHHICLHIIIYVYISSYMFTYHHICLHIIIYVFISSYMFTYHHNFNNINAIRINLQSRLLQIKMCLDTFLLSFKGQ